MSKFLWGSATAAYQCEGGWDADGKGESIWDDYVHSDRNFNKDTGDIACDHYNRFEEDIKMLADGGQNTYRFSISWPRILPKGRGEVNEKGVEFYKNMIETCLKYNVVPFVTLYHWDLPKVLHDEGGWENRATIDAFIEFSKICFDRFGTSVKHWVTVNEAEYNSMMSYLVGNYPPHVQDLSRRSNALYNMLLASARCVIEYKRLGLDGNIGLVHASANVEIFEDTDEYRDAARSADLFFNKSITDIAILGHFPEGLKEKMIATNIDISYALESDMETFKEGVVDFIGLNIYERAVVKPYTTGETIMTMNNKADPNMKSQMIIKDWFERTSDPDVKITPWGGEIYPKAMYDELIEIKDRYGDIPIYITENGVGLLESIDENDEIRDEYRIEVLNEYITWMQKAMTDGVNVKGYYVWSTFDVYSWVNGYNKRYGLVYIDFDNKQKRIPKQSYYWFKNFIEKEKENE